MLLTRCRSTQHITFGHLHAVHRGLQLLLHRGPSPACMLRRETWTAQHGTSPTARIASKAQYTIHLIERRPKRLLSAPSNQLKGAQRILQTSSCKSLIICLCEKKKKKEWRRESQRHSRLLMAGGSLECPSFPVREPHQWLCMCPRRSREHPASGAAPRSEDPLGICHGPGHYQSPQGYRLPALHTWIKIAQTAACITDQRYASLCCPQQLLSPCRAECMVTWIKLQYILRWQSNEGRAGLQCGAG